MCTPDSWKSKYIHFLDIILRTATHHPFEKHTWNFHIIKYSNLTAHWFLGPQTQRFLTRSFTPFDFCTVELQSITQSWFRTFNLWPVFIGRWSADSDWRMSFFHVGAEPYLSAPMWNTCSTLMLIESVRALFPSPCTDFSSPPPSFRPHTLSHSTSSLTTMSADYRSLFYPMAPLLHLRLSLTCCISSVYSKKNINMTVWGFRPFKRWLLCCLYMFEWNKQRIK